MIFPDGDVGAGLCCLLSARITVAFVEVREALDLAGETLLFDATCSAKLSLYSPSMFKRFPVKSKSSILFYADEARVIEVCRSDSTGACGGFGVCKVKIWLHRWT